MLAVAGVDSDRVDALLKRLIADSIATSIYRARLLTLSYETGTRDEFGDVEKVEHLRVSFTVAAPVSRREFVVDDGLYKLLWRNVVDLYARREVLKTHGVPIRRGVLLYGPPGTGKTFACRYLCGQLNDTTRIVVTGSALNRIGQLFDFARTYQPSVVILEDVDLAFAARDINLYSSSLGDLLDQMDGLRPSDDIGVILTTNSIERLEAAIKDRPGRISQCVYFGPPGDTLRRRYLEQYARRYDCTATDLERLVEMSDGTTPAFIKEWVHRTVQIATEDPDGDATLRLSQDAFEEAFDEMKRSGDSSARIVGFLPETRDPRRSLRSDRRGGGTAPRLLIRSMTAQAGVNALVEEVLGGWGDGDYLWLGPRRRLVEITDGYGGTADAVSTRGSSRFSTPCCTPTSGGPVARFCSRPCACESARGSSVNRTWYCSAMPKTCAAATASGPGPTWWSRWSARISCTSAATTPRRA